MECEWQFARLEEQRNHGAQDAAVETDYLREEIVEQLKERAPVRIPLLAANCAIRADLGCAAVAAIRGFRTPLGQCRSRNLDSSRTPQLRNRPKIVHHRSRHSEIHKETVRQ
jgi:hypothetical protein